MNNKLKNDLANQWRNVVGVSSLILGFILIGIFGSSDFASNLKAKFPSKSSFLVAKVVESSVVEAGGDVVIDPPKFVIPELPELVGEPVDDNIFSASSMIVKDEETGTVLFKKNEYDRRPIASVTKLMSALVLLEQNIDWSTTTTVVGDNVIDTHVYAGDTYTLEELWQAGLIASSNKAILTLVDYIHWTEEAFMERMNQKAIELGMADTEFVEPTGLDENNISTASDVSILLAEVLKHEKISEVLKEKELNLFSKERNKKHHMWSTNWVLLGWVSHNFSHFYGGKTGFIPASGYNFTMQVGDEKGHIINIVVLGAKSHEDRFTEARDIGEWVFENYTWPDDLIEGEEKKSVSSTLFIELDS